MINLYTNLLSRKSFGDVIATRANCTAALHTRCLYKSFAPKRKTFLILNLIILLGTCSSSSSRRSCACPLSVSTPRRSETWYLRFQITPTATTCTHPTDGRRGTAPEVSVLLGTPRTHRVQARPVPSTATARLRSHLKCRVQ